VTPGSFRGTEIARLIRSGWVRCPSITEAVLAVGLPAITEEYLERAFAEPVWPAAEAAVAGLRERFCSARFADDVRYGVLLVPDPARLDTRRAMPESVRRDQLRTPGDVFDGRLPDGVLGLRPGVPWSLVATGARLHIRHRPPTAPAVGLDHVAGAVRHPVRRRATICLASSRS
jgi:hypothetical protein